MALSCRLIYRESRDFVNMFEPQIAALAAVSECARVRFQIRTRREMFPSSLTDFVRKAALWVKLRGFCPEEPSIAINSFTTWRRTDSAYRNMVKRDIEVQPHDLVTWGTFTIFLWNLQLDLQEDVKAIVGRQMSTLQHCAFPARAVCDTATLLEYQRLCLMIWDRSISMPFFSAVDNTSMCAMCATNWDTFPKLLLTAASYHDGTRELTRRPMFNLTDVHVARIETTKI